MREAHESVPLERAVLGALAGVTSGAIDAVLAYQVMLTDSGVIPGWLWYIIEATVVGSVLELGSGTPTTDSVRFTPYRQPALAAALRDTAERANADLAAAGLTAN
jgi:hypothetical protein